MAASAQTKRLAESVAASSRALADRRTANRERPVSVPDMPKVDIVGPTPEQLARARFELADIVDKRIGGTTFKLGKAYRKRAMIEVLGDEGVFSDAELKALRTYRTNAEIADRSPLKDSLNRQPSTANGLGPTAALISAMQVRDDCERAAGSLRDILVAIVLYDVSLSQWAMAKHGSIEVRRTDRKRVQMQPTKSGLAIARLEIRMAAKRVEAELDA